jgi:3-oxoacyl-[acyl-carrier protein] reductase
MAVTVGKKVAVITGASKGIGAATAIAFAKDSYDVVINYLSDEDAAKKVAETVTATGNHALLVQADVFTAAGVEKLFAAIAQAHTTIDVLVNNAGLPSEPAFGQWAAQDITDSFTANVTSAILCTQAAAPLMSSGGSILFTSSIYGLPFGGDTSLALYSAGKAALNSFAQTMAEQLAPRIRCNIVAPGFTKTPTWDNVDPAAVQACLDETLQKEWVTAEEIASSFVFLAKTPHITAQTIVVDAGRQRKFR